MLIYKGNWTDYLKSYRMMMSDNKPNGSQLMGSMWFWDQLPGTGQARRGQL